MRKIILSALRSVALLGFPAPAVAHPGDASTIAVDITPTGVTKG